MINNTSATRGTIDRVGQLEDRDLESSRTDKNNQNFVL